MAQRWRREGLRGKDRGFSELGEIGCLRDAARDFGAMKFLQVYEVGAPGVSCALMVLY
jgi:hypothetical protein